MSADVRRDGQAQLKERLATIEHERWSHWQRYLHSKCVRNGDGSLTIPPSLVSRWERQIATRFSDLTESEKAADRAEVERYWPLIEAALMEPPP